MDRWDRHEHGRHVRPRGDLAARELHRHVEDRRGAAVFIPAFAVAAIVPLAFFGSSLSLWSAIHLAMTPVHPDDDVDLDWLAPSKPSR